MLTPWNVIEPHLSKASAKIMPTVITFKFDSLRAAVGFKGALVQAWYGINAKLLQDMVVHNKFLNDFIGFDAQQVPIDAYQSIQEQLMERELLQNFLKSISEDMQESDVSILHECASKIEQWMELNCPKFVFFYQHTKSPITGVMLELHSERDFDEDAMNEAIRHVFPHKEQFPWKSEELQELSDKCMTDLGCQFSPDRTHYVVMSGGSTIELHREPPYDSWLTFGRYLEALINAWAVLGPSTELMHVKLIFLNKFYLPSLSDYFHMYPDLPVAPETPSLLKAYGGKYELPNTLRSMWNETSFRYADGDPRHLNISMIGHEGKESGYEFELALTAIWRQKTKLVEVLDVANTLKDCIYVAFHSLLKEKARQLIL